MKQQLADLLYSDPLANGAYWNTLPDTAAVNDEFRLIQQVLSTRTNDRICAAQSLGSLPSSHYYFVIRLLQDDDATVRQTMLTTLGFNDCDSLWQTLIEAIGDIETRRIAAAMLVAFGEAVVPAIQAQWNEVSQAGQQRLIRVLKRIGGAQAQTLLLNELQHGDEKMRTMVVETLKHHGCRAQQPSHAMIERQISTELQHAAMLITASIDLAAAPESSLAALPFLNGVIDTQLERCRQRIAGYLALLPDEADNPATATALYQDARQLLQSEHPEQQSPPLSTVAVQPGLDWIERLIAMLEQPGVISDPWLWVCTAYTALSLNLNEPRIINALTDYQQSHPRDRLIMETVNMALAKLDHTQQTPQLSANPVTHRQPLGYKPMFSTIEKVIFLKGVNLFYETPDAILIELASLLEEIEVPANAIIFEKGAAADCMYIIVEGRVKVHDGERILNHQGRGEVFGELALLDDQPRLASITAIENTRLLKLDQEGFYLLMEDHIEFVRGVIRVLSGYLRGNLRNITDPEFKLSVQKA